MQQVLHLLVVDRERREALVTRHGAKWLLPIVHTPERTRAPLAVLQWAAQRRVPGRIVGQWLGRVAADLDAIDWLVVVDATGSEIGETTLQWMPLALFRSSAWLEYEQWAVATAIRSDCTPMVPGPFGTMTWIDEVSKWIAEVTGAAQSVTRARIVPHRATAYEVVLELKRSRGSIYFKGLDPTRASEVTVTSALADIAPESFARTLALRWQDDGTAWWLTEACRGSALAQKPTPGRIARAATAYARVQQRLVDGRPSAGLEELPRLALPQLASWATDLIQEVDSRRCASEFQTAIYAIQHACERVNRCALPHTWMFADFDPSNVFVDGSGVRFIDLDDCCLAPAPLAIPTFARRLKRIGVCDVALLSETYRSAWDPALAIQDRWPAFDIVSRVVECYHGWRRGAKKAGRGEVFGVLEAADDVIARRLARAIEALSSDDTPI